MEVKTINKPKWTVTFVKLTRIYNSTKIELYTLQIVI